MKGPLLVLISALVLRLIIFCVNPPPLPEYGDPIRQIGPQGDDVRYDQYAVNFLQGWGLNVAGEAGKQWVDIRRPPGMLFWLAGIYSIFGYDPDIAVIFNIILDSCTALLLVFLAQNFLAYNHALITGLLYALYVPAAVHSSGIILTEPLQTFMLICFCITILKLPSIKSLSNIALLAALTGILLASAAYIKASYIASIAMVWIIVLIWLRGNTIEYKKAAVILLASTTMFVTLVLPQFFWMKRTFGVFTFKPHWGVYAIVNGISKLERKFFNRPDLVPAHLLRFSTIVLRPRDPERSQTGRRLWNAHEEQTHERRQFISEYLRENPVHYLAGLLWRSSLLIPRSAIAWGTDPAPLMRRKHLDFQYIHILVLAGLPSLLSLSAIVFLFFQIKQYWIPLLVIVYIFLPYQLTHASPRYGLPASPYVFLGLVGCLAAMKLWIKERKASENSVSPAT